MKALAETFNECVFLENLYKYINMYHRSMKILFLLVNVYTSLELRSI